MTAYTIIASPAVYQVFEGQELLISDCLEKAISGITEDYGLELLDKQYE